MYEKSQELLLDSSWHSVSRTLSLKSNDRVCNSLFMSNGSGIKSFFDTVEKKFQTFLRGDHKMSIFS